MAINFKAFFQKVLAFLKTTGIPFIEKNFKVIWVGLLVLFAFMAWNGTCRARSAEDALDAAEKEAGAARKMLIVAQKKWLDADNLVRKTITEQYKLIGDQQIEISKLQGANAVLAGKYNSEVEKNKTLSPTEIVTRINDYLREGNSPDEVFLLASKKVEFSLAAATKSLNIFVRDKFSLAETVNLKEMIAKYVTIGEAKDKVIATQGEALKTAGETIKVGSDTVFKITNENSVLRDTIGVEKRKSFWKGTGFGIILTLATYMIFK